MPQDSRAGRLRQLREFHEWLDPEGSAQPMTGRERLAAIHQRMSDLMEDDDDGTATQRTATRRTGSGPRGTGTPQRHQTGRELSGVRFSQPPTRSNGNGRAPARDSAERNIDRLWRLLFGPD